MVIFFCIECLLENVSDQIACYITIASKKIKEDFFFFAKQKEEEIFRCTFCILQAAAQAAYGK